MIQSNWIAYVGPFKYPSQQAGAQRVNGIARALTNAGYDTIIGSGESIPMQLVALEQEEGKGKLAYIGLGELPPFDASTVSKSFAWFVNLGNRTVRWLDKQPTKPSHVILYAPHALMVFRLLQWCRHHGVALIIDVVEWYNSWHVLGGPVGPFNISIKLALRILNPRSDGIIVISSYLATYYQRRGCRVICVPPTLNVKTIEPHVFDEQRYQQPLTLAYAGTPGKKDRLDNVIEALLRLDPNGERVRLYIAGSTTQDVLNLFPLRSRGASELPLCLKVLGPQPHDKAVELVRKADFVPLLRPNQRYAQAGFPTKVTESLAAGTPVICNLTGDLGQYIRDGIEGFVCYDHSPEAFVEALERALRKTPQQRLEMRQAARLQAERSFDYHIYSERLAIFLQEM